MSAEHRDQGFLEEIIRLEIGGGDDGGKSTQGGVESLDGPPLGRFGSRQYLHLTCTTNSVTQVDAEVTRNVTPRIGGNRRVWRPSM